MSTHSKIYTDANGNIQLKNPEPESQIRRKAGRPLKHIKPKWNPEKNCWEGPPPNTVSRGRTFVAAHYRGDATQEEVTAPETEEDRLTRIYTDDVKQRYWEERT